MSKRLEFALRGAGGEPVDLWRTIVSHGVAELPPARINEEARTLELTLALDRRPARTVVISSGRRAHGAVEIMGPRVTKADVEGVLSRVRHVLNLDEDLSEFYAVAAADPDLGWAAAGAGRMLRMPTVFEAVVKTICTTNCAWSATRRMVGALVDHLGEPSVGEHGRTFPTPAAMADAGEAFYRDVARAGYRGPYLRSLASSVAQGADDLEHLVDPTLADEEVAARLLALPGIGPYGAAHVMMLVGRHSRLILDSWTRPKYARLMGRKAADRTIERRFRRYGSYAGLAFWLFLTRDWVEEAV
jgi:3-methyladenine DNA glycosylase/8-oxoguanine DNA glycosylase